MRLEAVRAIYRDGVLVFADPSQAPKGATEVMITYLAESQTETSLKVDPINVLRGRGKGERLVEKLLKARREDRERNERSPRPVRA